MICTDTDKETEEYAAFFCLWIEKKITKNKKKKKTKKMYKKQKKAVKPPL